MKNKQISDKLRLSLLLELQTTPKPGCVDRNYEHEDTSFIDFINSSIKVGRAFEENYGSKLGEIIYKSTKKMIKSSGGVNTHFGSILLHTPLFKATKELENFSIEKLIEKATELVEYSDVEDSINFYNALNIVEIGGLGKRNELDAGSEEAIQEISEEGISFFELMELSRERDGVARELVNSFQRTKEGYNFLKDKEINNQELVKTFIYLLKEPDTHVEKVHSKEIAKEVSNRAEKIIKNNYRLKDIKKLDKELNKKSISPGTTADILSSSIYLKLLEND